MNGSLKKSARTLYGVCTCIIVLMVICYFGVSNTKGTYSADGQVTCDGTIYSGTKAWLSGGVYYCCPASTSEMTGGMCYYYNNDCGSKTQCDDVNPTGANWSCSTSYESLLTGYKRTCSVSAVKAITVSDDSSSSGACYVANHRYVWLLTDPNNSSYTKVDKSSAQCSGCESGYVDDNEGYCIEDDDITYVTLRFMNGDNLVKSESCTFKPSVASRCSNSIIAPGAQTKIGDTTGEYTFNGWGEADGCAAGSYTANASFAPAVSKTYYACYKKTSDDDKTSDFDSSKCTYSSLYTVTRDERYLNCKYTNITYNNSAMEDTSGNIKACCTNKGYTWVSENFTSSGYGNEYCIVCSSTSGGGGGGTPTPSSSSSSKPSSSSSLTGPGSPTPSSNVDDNPKTGSVAIFMVWVIALGTLIYSFVYFKQSKFE